MEETCKLYIQSTTDRCLVCGKLKWEHETKQNR